MIIKTINNITCVGTPTSEASYEITFDNEYQDFICNDLEATTWKQVIKQLSRFKGIQQIIACE